ncbi:hypothetical protein GCD22_00089 [Acidithiobacillus thiooxidans ATCC 19377]|uniref:Uncharacterized protein n=1 Tax=Acidithiobacillus thiooxidans ATCC 19377 TaxID=637390 RepID=A0A5P9XND1_ACITH|nr:hypothetical protein GCD22_00089 [Acidithiobacillus thiooxidans ATCC 19377]
MGIHIVFVIQDQTPSIEIIHAQMGTSKQKRSLHCHFLKKHSLPRQQIFGGHFW